ncbi:unnamed protein product [Heterobilharzia americana]|nr:unnamed protein product [Heterobilharzia americana]
MKLSSLGKSSRPLFLSTLVLFDVETTGLPSANFNPEITELCMLASSRFNLENATGEPRVENKLTLCFNPTRTISSIASKISGKNYSLNDCTNGPIVCTDTLHLFREFASQLAGTNSDDSGFISTDDQSSTPVPVSHSSPKKPITTTNKHSFHLADVHERVFGDKHKNAHSAEGDCRAMLRLIQYLGSPAIDWLQSHYLNFNSVTPMYNLPSANTSRLSSSLFPYQRTTKCILMYAFTIPLLCLTTYNWNDPNIMYKYYFDKINH